MITLSDATVVAQDTTPGRFLATFTLKYSMVREVLGNIRRGASVNIDGIKGTIQEVEIISERDAVNVLVHIEEGIC